VEFRGAARWGGAGVSVTVQRSEGLGDLEKYFCAVRQAAVVEEDNLVVIVWTLQ
jgi:hypothetical protein